MVKVVMYHSINRGGLRKAFLSKSHLGTKTSSLDRGGRPSSPLENCAQDFIRYLPLRGKFSIVLSVGLPV